MRLKDFTLKQWFEALRSAVAFFLGMPKMAPYAFTIRGLLANITMGAVLAAVIYETCRVFQIDDAAGNAVGFGVGLALLCQGWDMAMGTPVETREPQIAPPPEVLTWRQQAILTRDLVLAVMSSPLVRFGPFFAFAIWLIDAWRQSP